MSALDVSDAAKINLAEIEAYLTELADAETAEIFVEGLVDHCERLAQMPGIFGTARSDLAPNVRSTPYRKYVIYFRYLDDTLQVVAVIHGRRDALTYFSKGDDA